MEYIYIGKLVNTHGLKGEVRILSSFTYKKEVFLEGMILYLGEEKEAHKILSYRPHKIYDMVCLGEIDSIEKAELYKGKKVYIKKDSIRIDGYFDEELMGLAVVYGGTKIGYVEDILESKAHKILVVGKTLIPYVDAFIQKVDIEKKCIFLNEMEGLLHED